MKRLLTRTRRTRPTGSRRAEALAARRAEAASAAARRSHQRIELAVPSDAVGMARFL